MSRASIAAAVAAPWMSPAFCMCVTCAQARQADRRDAKLMLRAERIRSADVSPSQRVEWDAYIAARAEAGGYVPRTARSA